MHALDGWIGAPWYVLATGVVIAGWLSQELSRAFCHDFGLKDYPNRRKIHTFPVPVSGGPGLFLPCLIAYFLWMAKGAPGLGLFTGALLGCACTGIFVMGFIDDLKGIPARKRLWIQAAMAYLLWLAGFRLDALHFGAWTLDLAMFSLPVTLFWFMGFVNTSNLMDGMDGLSGGMNLIALASLSAFGFWAGSTAGIVALILAGLVTIFLFYNFAGTRKVFLGDSGSLCLGLSVGLIAIVAARSGSAPGLSWIPLALAVAAYSVGIIDVIYAIVRRRRNGTSPFMPDSHHIHHKLLRSGMSQGQIRILFLCPSSALTLMVALPLIGKPWYPLLIGVSTVLVMIGGAVAFWHVVVTQLADVRSPHGRRPPARRLAAAEFGERKPVAPKVVSY